MDITTTKRKPQPSGYDRSGQMMLEFWPFRPQISTACPECGAPEVGGYACRELFEQLLELESKDPDGAGSVHNLSVLCYVLQHPKGYSNAALNWGISALRDCLEVGPTQRVARPEPRGLFSWLRRTPKALATAWRSEEQARPAIPSRWHVTIDKVFQPDPQGHPDRVQQWARAILTDLQPPDRPAEA